MINSLLLMHQQVHPDVPLNVYSLNAFNPAKYCGTNITGDFIAKCKNGVTDPDENFFNDRIPKNAGGCIIKAIAMTWPPFVNDVNSVVDPGIEVVVLKTLASIFNITVSFKQSEQPWGDRAVNGRYIYFSSELRREWEL